MGFVVKAVEFMDEGVQFVFVEVPDDLRENGMLLNRMLFVPERAMPDELQALMEKAQATVTQAMYEHQKAGSVDPAQMHALYEEGGDEEPSPWDNPAERAVPNPKSVYKTAETHPDEFGPDGYPLEEMGG